MPPCLLNALAIMSNTLRKRALATKFEIQKNLRGRAIYIATPLVALAYPLLEGIYSKISIGIGTV